MNQESINEETQRRVQELQVLEHNLQHIAMQKQSFQLELNETINALEEVKKTDGEVYRMAGSIMLKSDKKIVLKDLEEKKKTLELRLSSVEKQEKLLESKAKELQEEAKKFMNKKEE